MAMTTDAFTMNWAELRAYAKPPWNLIRRVLAQTRQQQAELVLVGLVWKTQVWYPVLVEMVIHILLMIPQRRDLIQATHQESDPISGPVGEVVNFLAHLYVQGYQYRSAISSVHEKVDGYGIGQHPLVSRTLKGILKDLLNRGTQKHGMWI